MLDPEECCFIRPPFSGMRKLKHKNGPDKKVVKSNNIPSKAADTAPKKLDSIDEDDQGFGGWLRSTEGLENMKLFVIANSIVLLTTLALPHVQTIVDMIAEAIYGADSTF